MREGREPVAWIVQWRDLHALHELLQQRPALAVAHISPIMHRNGVTFAPLNTDPEFSQAISENDPDPDEEDYDKSL